MKNHRMLMSIASRNNIGVFEIVYKSPMTAIMPPTAAAAIGAAVAGAKLPDPVFVAVFAARLDNSEDAMDFTLVSLPLSLDAASPKNALVR